MTLHNEPNHRAEDRLWSARDCWEYLGIGPTSFYELVKESDFPDAIQIGRRSVRYSAFEVRRYAESRRVGRVNAP